GACQARSDARVREPGDLRVHTSRATALRDATRRRIRHRIRRLTGTGLRTKSPSPETFPDPQSQLLGACGTVLLHIPASRRHLRAHLTARQATGLEFSLVVPQLLRLLATTCRLFARLVVTKLLSPRAVGSVRDAEEATVLVAFACRFQRLVRAGLLPPGGGEPLLLIALLRIHRRTPARLTRVAPAVAAETATPGLRDEALRSFTPR